MEYFIPIAFLLCALFGALISIFMCLTKIAIKLDKLIEVVRTIEYFTGR